MRIKPYIFALAALTVGAVACSGSDGTEAAAGDPQDDGASNPFFENQDNAGKADTAYMNPDGIEVEVDVEADVAGPAYRIMDGPAAVAQYGLTYLRKRGEFYLESLAEDASSDQRVEWQVDGNWLTAAQTSTVSKDKLKHFRIRGVDAVLLNKASQGVKTGQVFTAKVPVNPFTVMSDAQDTCADPDDHMTLDESIYWYMWNPDKAGCKAKVQDMKVTVSKTFASGKVTYPEYDKLVADGKVTTVILFGQIGDGAITDSDPGMRAFKQMSTWLTTAKFTEVTPAPVGRRFSKLIGTTTLEIDLYSPKEFSGLDDMAHFGNFQKGLSEHEIVVYDGHSMLGASDFWSKPSYPNFYQVFLYGGCLGYEYYVQPILKGKKGWANLDIMSSVVEVSANANQFAGPFLAKLIWALDHNYEASWKDMLLAVRKSVGDSTFGASGVRDNCFSPTGSLCTPGGTTGTETKQYDNKTATAIPDNNPTGVTSVIDVPDTFNAKSLTIALDVSHTWVGDLKISVEHDGVTAVIWNKAGGAGKEIKQSFTVAAFAGKAVKGKWTIKLVDAAKSDTGKLNAWSVIATK